MSTKTTQAAIEAAQPRKKIQLSAVEAKPKLVSIVLDDEAVFEEFGGDLEFFVWDRYPVPQFMDIMRVAEKAQASDTITQEEAEINRLIVIEKAMPLMLDEKGKPLNTDNLDPVIVLLAVHKVIEHLGNLSAGNRTGKHQK